jgi:hypothetical protein
MPFLGQIEIEMASIVEQTLHATFYIGSVGDILTVF